jgi:putative flippase GtrA
MSLPRLAREGGLFAVVGAAATLVHLIVALTASGLWGFPPLTANIVGYLAAVSVSYLGNAVLTFRRPTRDAAQLLRFVVVSVAGLALNQATVYLLVERAGWPFHLALGPVIVLVPSLSFLLSKFWAFGRAARG